MRLRTKGSNRALLYLTCVERINVSTTQSLFLPLLQHTPISGQPFNITDGRTDRQTEAHTHTGREECFNERYESDKAKVIAGSEGIKRYRDRLRRICRRQKARNMSVVSGRYVSRMTHRQSFLVILALYRATFLIGGVQISPFSPIPFFCFCVHLFLSSYCLSVCLSQSTITSNWHCLYSLTIYFGYVCLSVCVSLVLSLLRCVSFVGSRNRRCHECARREIDAARGNSRMQRPRSIRRNERRNEE